MTLEALEKEYIKGQENKEKKEKALADLKDKAASKEREKRDAANAGNLEKFRKATAELDALNEEIFVLSQNIAHTENPFSDKDILEAWTKYAAFQNKRQDERIAEIAQAREALKTAVLKLIDEKREACAARAKWAGIMGIDYFALDATDESGGRYIPREKAKKILPLKAIELKRKSFANVVGCPEIEYLVHCGAIGAQELPNDARKLIEKNEI